MVPICTEWWCTEANKATQTHAIIQSRRLTLFGHIMCMDDNADAKILLASPPADWRRQLGRPRITWLSTIQQDLKHHHLTLPEAADLAQNRSLWRMMSTYGATQSRVARQKRRFIGWLVGLYVTTFPQMLRINFHKILRVRTIWRWHRSRCMGYFKSNIRNCPSSDIQLRKILPVYYYLLTVSTTFLAKVWILWVLSSFIMQLLTCTVHTWTSISQPTSWDSQMTNVDG